MYRSDREALEVSVVALRDAARLADVASLSMPDVEDRLGLLRSLKAVHDLMAGRLAAQAKHLHGREGAAAAADAAGLSKNETDRLSATAAVVDALPRLEDAVSDGSVSAADAALIAGACEKDPTPLRRGDTHEGERCEIPGVGPVNAAWVRSILGDATVKLIIRNGVDITAVAHFGRHIPAEVMTALLFQPRRCSHPGCINHGYLERDHLVEVSRGGATSLANLQWLCAHHHRHKTQNYSGKRYRPKKRGSPEPQLAT